MAKRHHTPLNKRKKQGTAIKSPLHILGDKIGWSSWKDDHLPDMMWACMATGQLSRHEYIELFRQIAARASKKWKDVKHIYLTHAGLSNASYLDFEFVFEPLKSSAIGERIISTLARVEALPDLLALGTDGILVRIAARHPWHGCRRAHGWPQCVRTATGRR